MAKRSKFQQKAIKNFYNNREAIALQRAQELVTELYLTEGKMRQRHWKNLTTHLLALGEKQEKIDQLIAQDNPESVANLLKTHLK
jgi:hypothetical protein